MPSGIKDKVAIIGMGCTMFGERWDAGPEELMVEAWLEAAADAGIDTSQLDAAWLATYVDDLGAGKGGTSLAAALRLPNIAVTRVENFCASGTEALRGAVYAVAAGAADITLALGVEKLKDSGYGGLPVASPGTLTPQIMPNGTAPGNFAQVATAYGTRNGVGRQDLKRAMAHVSVKSHANGARNPKAHLRNLISEEIVLNAPIIADPLGLYDCCGVSDGAAAAIVTTPEIAARLGHRDPVLVKAMQLSVSNGWESQQQGWNGAYIHTARLAAQRAYREAEVGDPRREVSMVEVHDCFSITELVTMEDLFLSQEGQAWRDVLDGVFDRDGALPCQLDGGLKCFGHPIGASGLRMLYEMYLQLRGRAGERQLGDCRLGMTHNLGGAPWANVCSVTLVGLKGA